MAKKESSQEEEDITEALRKITPFVKEISPSLLENQRIKAPIIKRGQIINFSVMMTLILSIGILAYFKIIDGSAATGLLGAIIGYVFGGLYNKNK